MYCVPSLYNLDKSDIMLHEAHGELDVLPQFHVQDYKLVSSQQTARMYRIDHVGADVTAADQTMFNGN